MAWYETFFSGMALDLWRALATPEQTEAEVEGVLRWLAPPGGGALLDVPCGNGRHARRLAARGYCVTGVDISEEFLAEARAASAAEALAAAWVRADMAALPDVGRFDGAACLGNSFGYLDRAGMAAFAAGLARALVPGARLVVETGMAAESLLPLFDPRVSLSVGDIRVEIVNAYEPAEGRLDSTYVFERRRRREARRASHWVFTAAEIRRLLGEAGLETVGLYADLDGAPFAIGAPRLFVVAER